jgi:hypothetical protein
MVALAKNDINKSRIVGNSDEKAKNLMKPTL